jgi:hypothetical protein
VCCDGICALGCTDPPPPPPPLCTSAATCGAHEVCCNGECQPDGETCVAPPPQCATSADCTGGLPQLCEICGDGQSQCAHFECIAGTCEVVICDPIPSTSNQ